MTEQPDPSRRPDPDPSAAGRSAGPTADPTGAAAAPSDPAPDPIGAAGTAGAGWEAAEAGIGARRVVPAAAEDRSGAAAQSPPAGAGPLPPAGFPTPGPATSDTPDARPEELRTPGVVGFDSPPAGPEELRTPGVVGFDSPPARPGELPAAALGAPGDERPTEAFAAGGGASVPPDPPLWGTGGATAAGPGGGGFPPPGAGPGGGGFPPPGAGPGGGFPPPPAVDPAGGGWPGGERLRLRRSTRRKVVAGVAGGLGEYTGIDPVLFRVLFAVLTLFGGTGILLYVIGWLFLPADDQPVSPVESLIGRGTGPHRLGDAAKAGLLIVAGLVLAGVLARGDAGDVVLLLVVVGGAAYIVRNLADRRSGTPPAALAPAPPPQPYERPAYEPQPAATAVAERPAPGPLVTGGPPAPPRERSILGVLTISALLVVLGVTAALDAGDVARPAAEDYLALAVATLGAGLIVGAWFGRARWLTWLGLPALALLMVLGTSGVSLEGGVGDRNYAPARAALIQDEYRVGVGSLRLDLSDVDFTEQLVRTRVSAGVGNVEVVVPDDVDVSVDSRAGIGEVLLFGESQDGTSVDRTVVDHGTGGDGRIDLVLDLEVNIGQVRVDRAQA